MSTTSDKIESEKVKVVEPAAKKEAPKETPKSTEKE